MSSKNCGIFFITQSGATLKIVLVLKTKHQYMFLQGEKTVLQTRKYDLVCSPIASESLHFEPV